MFDHQTLLFLPDDTTQHHYVKEDESLAILALNSMRDVAERDTLWPLKTLIGYTSNVAFAEEWILLRY